MTAKSGQEAVANARDYSTYDQGMCQKYVRGPCWEVGSLYGSAIEAWNGSTQKHKGDRNPPVGAPCYYQGGQYGHVVICVGGGRARSTDTTSAYQVGEQPLDWWERHWSYSYLGWTGDINAVDLPLGQEDDDVGYKDWSKEDKQALLRDVSEAVWTGYHTINAADDRYPGVVLAQTWQNVQDIEKKT